MISATIVTLLILAYASAFSVSCTKPIIGDKTVEADFVCTFPEATKIAKPDFIFAPRLKSIIPESGESNQFTFKVEVPADLKGEITLFFGEGVFSRGEEVSEEASFTTPGMAPSVTPKVSVATLSSEPDFAIITIGGGAVIRPDIFSVDDLAVFPSCVEVISIETTPSAYLVKVFVKDVAAFEKEHITLKAGIIRSYWGESKNYSPNQPIVCPEKSVASTSLPMWPTSGKMYVSDSEFVYDLPYGACPMDIQSFAGSNVEILAVENVGTHQRLRGRLVGDAVIGRLTFIGYTPDQCTIPAYPAQDQRSVVVVKEVNPEYEISHAVTEAGCMNVTVKFTAPVKTDVSAGYLTIVKDQYTTSVDVFNEMMIFPMGDGLFRGIQASVRINNDEANLGVSVNGAVVKTPSGADLKSTPVTPIKLMKKVFAIQLHENQTSLIVYHNETYVSKESSFKFIFVAANDTDIPDCDFSHVFTSDNNVQLLARRTNTQLELEVITTQIDRHVIEIHPERLTCSVATSYKFIQEEIKFAYDPAFKPGDIIVTLVNTKHSMGFHFFPLRKLFTWNKIFFTDAGWANEFLRFIDHGSDGFISFVPRTDIDAGVHQRWSDHRMNATYDVITANKTNLDYPFSHEHHGFNLETQDNLFVYVTDNNDVNSEYDSWSKIKFIFGIYWSSSQWANQTSDYHQITSEYSALPDELFNAGTHVAVGKSANPPRGVNYMVVDEAIFDDGYTHTREQVLECIANSNHWNTSQIYPFMPNRDPFMPDCDPFMSDLDPAISFTDREIDFTYTLEDGKICFTTFHKGITVTRNDAKIHLSMNGENVPFTATFHNQHCVYYTIPQEEGEIEVTMEAGFLTAIFSSNITYPTTSTAGNDPHYPNRTIPFTYDSVPHTFFIPIYHIPVVDISMNANALYQKVVVTSTVECSEWGTFTATSGDVILLSQNERETVFAVAFQQGGRLTVEDGFCMTAGGRQSSLKVSASSNVQPLPAHDTILKNVFVRDLFTNNDTVAVKLELSGYWQYDESKLRMIPTYDHYDYNRGMHIFRTESGETQSITLPYGCLRNSLNEGSQPVTINFHYKNQSINVTNYMTFSWDETPLTTASMATVTLSGALSVINSVTPDSLVFFRDQCHLVGYSIDASQNVVLSVAVMHGMCTYGVNAGILEDPYRNTNLAFTVNKEFDFIPPKAVMAVVDDASSVYPGAEEMRVYWNYSPVLSIYFNETIVNFNETQMLVSVENCQIEFLSYIEKDNKSTVRYTLSGCTDEVTVTVVSGISISDNFGNSALSEEAIENSVIHFEMDFVKPTVTLEAVQTQIRDELDIKYTISEENTSFECADISIAVEEVSVHVMNRPEANICHYTFEPAPINGTYILVYMAADRFQDRARNTNEGFAPLSILVVNLGAQISVEPQEIYTHDITTEFTLTVTDRYLCPNFEKAFTSTFEYDREIARIDKVGEYSENEDGVITLTFAITFFNMDVYTNTDRYKDMVVHIPSRVCVDSMGLHNNPLNFTVTFDNEPAIPTVSMLSRNVDNMTVTLEAVYRDVTEFGSNDAEDYMVVTFEEAVLTCEVSRVQNADTYTYHAVCPVTQQGHLVITLMEGAVKERTGLESAEYSTTIMVDHHAPLIELSAPEGNTFGPQVTKLNMYLTVSELLKSMPLSCFRMEMEEMEHQSLVDININKFSQANIANQKVEVSLTRKENSTSIQGNFNVYVEERCVQDFHLNWNTRSNTLTFYYDFMAPVVTLDCPASNTVLNTFELTGSMNKPFDSITANNLIITGSDIASCHKNVEKLTDTTFRVSLNCPTAGSYDLYISSLMDTIGNTASSSNTCTGVFTISGPQPNIELPGLINSKYFSSKTFVAEVTAAPNCVSMELSTENVFVQNIETHTLVIERRSACHWMISGAIVEEGPVVIRVDEKAAVDVYGGDSISKQFEFESHLYHPTVMSLEPTLLSAGKTENVKMCFNETAIVRSTGTITASGGCTAVTIKGVDDANHNCLNLDVTVIQGERCYLTLSENVVSTPWEIGNTMRTVMMEIDDHPPALNLVATVAGEERVIENTDDANTKDIYVNGDLLLTLEVPAMMTVDTSKIVAQHVSAPTVQQVEGAVEITVALDAMNVFEKNVTLYLENGLLTDVFNRKSKLTTYHIYYSQEAVETTIVTTPDNSQLPIHICVSFNSTIFPMTEANIQSTVPFTMATVPSCDYQLSFTPEGEGEYFFEIVNVRSVYGNVAPTVRKDFVYFDSQPVIVEPFENVETTRVVENYVASIRLVFSRAMDVIKTNTIDDLLVQDGDNNDPLSVYFGLVNVECTGNVVVINYTAKYHDDIAMMDSYFFNVHFADNAFADLAGNTAQPYYFAMNVYNVPTRVVSALQHGGKYFSRLPIELTVTFSNKVTLSENYHTYITASHGETTLTFSGESVSGLVDHVTVISQETNVLLEAGQKWRVRVEAGIGEDIFGQLILDSFTDSLTSSSSMLINEEINYGANNNPVVHLTMDKPPKSLDITKMELENAVVREVVTEGRKMSVFLTVATQGTWRVTFLPESIEGTDGSLLINSIMATGEYDSIAPIVSCSIPTAIGMGAVTIQCVSDEPLSTESHLFQVVYQDMVIPHEETMDSSNMIATVTFTAIDTYVPDFFDYVYLTLDSCMDMASNVALPVRYRIPVDFTLPVVTLITSRNHVRTNETMSVVATFSKAITTDDIELQVAYNEDMAIVTVSDVTIVTPGLQYSWTVTLEATELTDNVVPVTFSIPAGYMDAFNNQNVETSTTVYLNDLSPELLVTYRQDEQVIDVDVTVLNGPIPDIDVDMLDLSNNLELIDVVAFQIPDGPMTFNLTFAAECTESCEYSIRFRSDRIFNLAGNPMVTEVPDIIDFFVMAPTVTISVAPFYHQAETVTLTFSENVDMNCNALVTSVPGVQAFGKSCLNTRECQCVMDVRTVETLTQITLQLPANTAINRFGVRNTQSSEVTFYFSPMALGVSLTTEWEQSDSVVDIPFIATTSFNQLTEEMVQCVECEITEWQQVENAESPYTYSFRVTFLSDNGNYARVFVAEGMFVDPFGRKNAYSEKVLRRNAEAAVMQHLTYDRNRPHIMELHFSMPVHSCGGNLVLTSLTNSQYSYSLSTSDLVITGRRVVVSLLPYGNQRYQVTWDERAFCDATNYPAAQPAEFHTFTMASDVPVPPTLQVISSSVTKRSAILEYQLNHDGGLAVHSVVLSLYSLTSESTPRVRVLSSESSVIMLDDLEPATTYQAVVAAVNNIGTGLPSLPVEFTTKTDTPVSATDLRVCNLLNPVTVDGLVTYNQAEACWTASESANVRYRLEVSKLEGENGAVQTTASVEVPEGATSMAFTLNSDVEFYRLTLITESTQPVEDAENFSTVSADFVTRIDLEDIERFPQGAGIVAVAERLTANSVVVSFNHPLENYFRIEKFQVQFGQSFPEIMDATAFARQTYTFPMDKCLGNQVTLTVRAGIANNFWGLPSNRVVIYCKTPRLQIVADPGFDYVAFRVTSEVKATATCMLKAAANPVELARLTVDVDPVNVAPYQLFKSLNPDTDYVIECMAQDRDYVTVSGQTSFYTSSTFVLPEFSVSEPAKEQVGSHYVHIPVESVSLPGTVYCLAKPVEQDFQASRSEYLNAGFAAYAFPRLSGMTVTITGLKPNTDYRARCMFDPDYSAAKVAARRLADEELLFTTADLSVPAWVRMDPFHSAAVPAFTELRLEAALPITLYHGELRLVAQKDVANTLVFNPSDEEVSVAGSVLLITPPTLVPGEEYALVMTPGFVVDAHSYAPMPGVSLAQKVAFTVITDAVLAHAPEFLRSVPEDKAVVEMADSNVRLIFDRRVRLSKSAQVKVTINGETSLVSTSALELSSSKVEVVVKTGRFFREGATVKVTVLPNSVCSEFGACVAVSKEILFTVADKTFSPAFLSIYPANEQESVPHGENVVLTFNKEIKLDNNYAVVFVDELNQQVLFHYGEEKSKVNPRLYVDDNKLVVRGDALPAGHTYTIVFDPMITDKEGRQATGLPAIYRFSTSAYSCSGNYIFEKMGENCECYSTNEKCECRCGKEDINNVIIGMKL